MSARSSGTVANDGAARGLRDSVTYLAHTGVVYLAPLIAVPVIGAYVAPAQYGAYGLAQAVCALACALANVGMLKGYDRGFFELEHEPTAPPRLLGTVLVASAVSLSVLVALALFLRRPLASMVLGDPTYAGLLALVLAATALRSLANYYFAALRNRGLSSRFLSYGFVESLVSLTGTVVALHVMELGVTGLGWAQLAAATALLLVMLPGLARDVPLCVDRALLRQVLAISVPLTPRVLLGAVNNQLDKLLLGMLASLGGLGIYAMGQKIAYVVFSFSTALDQVFIPEVYRRLFREAREGGNPAIGAYVFPFAFAGAGAALLVGLFAEEAIRLLLPESYAGAASIAKVLALFYATLFFGKITGPQLIYAKRLFHVSLISMVGIVFNVAISVPLILRCGAMGAAGGALVAGLLTQSIATAIAQRVAPVAWPVGRYASTYALLAVGLLGGWISKDFLGLGYEPRLAFKLVVVAIYVAIGVRHGLLSRETLAAVRGAWSIGRGASTPSPERPGA